MPGRDYILRFEGAEAWLQSDTGPMWARDLFDMSAHQHQGRLFITSKKSGTSAWSDPERLDAVAYPCFQPTRSGKKYYLKVYSASGHANTMQHFWELRLLPGPLGLGAGRQSSCKWALDNWFRWAPKFSKLFPEHVLLKKAIPPKREHAHVSRFLPEHCASTCGLLMILVDRSLTARPAGLRPDAFHLLESFLHRWLCDISFDIHITTDSGYRPNLGCDASMLDGMISVTVDGGAVDVKPLLAVGSETAVCQVKVLLQAAGSSDTGMVKAALLLQLASSHGHGWLYAQLLSELTLAITFAIKEQLSSLPTDPMNLPTDFEQFLEGKRLDRVVSDKLSLGEGTGQSTERVYNPAQHARSWALFKNCKRTLDVAFSMGRRLARYLHAGKEFMSDCFHLSVALDGSRFSGLDITMAVVQGTCMAEGVTKAMWAPPQVIS